MYLRHNGCWVAESSTRDNVEQVYQPKSTRTQNAQELNNCLKASNKVPTGLNSPETRLNPHVGDSPSFVCRSPLPTTTPHAEPPLATAAAPATRAAPPNTLAGTSFERPLEPLTTLPCYCLLQEVSYPHHLLVLLFIPPPPAIRLGVTGSTRTNSSLPVGLDMRFCC